MDNRPPPATGEPAPELREIRVRYAGRCVLCGSLLDEGVRALYHPRTRTLRCLECPSKDAGSDETSIDPGEAGGSAWREYERRLASRDASVKGTFGDRLGGLVLALSDAPQSTRAWARGALGEEALAEVLSGIANVIPLFDRRVRGTRGNIDALVVAPAGVFVVDVKQYKGRIEIRDKGWLLRSDRRLYVGRRDCSDLVDGMDWQVDAVEALLDSVGMDRVTLTPVLCFVHGDWPLLFPPDSYRGVRLEGPRSLRKLISRQHLLNADEIDTLARMLANAFPPR
jgi:hypothetical protein